LYDASFYCVKLWLFMHNPTLLEHFRNPRNAGPLRPPAVTVEVANPACGDILKLSAEIVDGRISRIGYQVRGCTASIAAGSATTELLAGKRLTEIAEISAAAVESAVGGLAPESKHAAALCVDGIKALIRTVSPGLK
jgi:nitrogen fixation NifU-like protein